MFSIKISFKQVFTMFLAMIISFSVFCYAPIQANALSNLEYNYDILCDGTVKITKYKGRASDYIVPTMVDGYSVTRIDTYAYYDCDTLTSVTVPSNIKSIGENAFQGCSLLNTVNISASVLTISKAAFKNCTALTTINIDDENPFYCSIEGNLFDKTKTELIQYAIGKESTSYTVPDTVEKIEQEAFYKSIISDITIPNTVKSIGEFAFSECEALKNVTYIGTEQEYNEIEFGEGNEQFKSAKITFSPKACTHTNKVVDKEVAATCTDAGKSVGSHCKDCGAVIEAEKVLKALGHSTTVQNQKSATYFAKGYSGDSVCKVCNKTIVKGKATVKKTLKKPTVKVTPGKKQFNVKYTKVNGATGFEVQYKLGKKTVTKTYSTKKTATRVIKKLAKGTYKVKVRAFVKQGKNKAYSAWTKTYTLNIK